MPIYSFLQISIHIKTEHLVSDRTQHLEGTVAEILNILFSDLCRHYKQNSINVHCSEVVLWTSENPHEQTQNFLHGQMFSTMVGATFNVPKKVQWNLLDPVCECMCVFGCVRVCTWVCGLGGGYCSLLVVVQSCLSCGTSVGCVMGSVEQFSVSGVKQAQSRALPDAMGTSGQVSLRIPTHAHMLTYESMKVLNKTDNNLRQVS